MTSGIFSKWLQEVWQNSKSSFFKPISLLILDSAKSNLTDKVQKQIKKYSKIAVTPEGFTKLLQPLGISVNKSFKNNLKIFWEDWIINDYHTFIKDRNMERAFYTNVCHWIIKSRGLKTPACKKIAFENI